MKGEKEKGEEVIEDREMEKFTASISCDYDEFEPHTYRGVRLKITSKSQGENLIFKSKSPLRDKNKAIEYARRKDAKIYVLSSWDNFVSDALMEIVKIKE